MKVKKKPWTALFPCPVVLVTCVDSRAKPNIITLAWVGTVCSDPPMLSIGVRPERYSYKLIENSGEFVANIPTEDILEETDICGTLTGRNVDKFLKTGLTAKPSEKVKPPIILECPVNIECIVKHKIPLGIHHLFLGEIVNVHVDEDVLGENGDFDPNRVTPIVFNQGQYWNLKEKIGKYGMSRKSTQA